VLNQVDDPVRARMLTEIADKESREVLFASFQTHRNLDTQAIIDKLLGSRSKSLRRLTMLFLAWNPDADANRLAQWLESQGAAVSSDESARLVKSYDPARLNISDYGYLLSRHPLDIWCAGQVLQDPGISWDELLRRSGRVRETASSWLFKTRNRRAQDLRNRRNLSVRLSVPAGMRTSVAWPIVDPFQPAIRTFERIVNVIEARVACARVGFRKRQLIVEMSMIDTEPAAARRAGAFRIFIAKPALHDSPL